MIPCLEPSPDERGSGTLDATSLAEAARSLRIKGCLMIKGAFPTELIDSLHRHFVAGYGRYFQPAEFADALTVGERRYKLSVALEGPFNTPSLFANPLVLSPVTELLGDEAILASLVSVIALPNAPDQGLHRDHPWLFGQVIDRMIPSYAIKLIIPLIDLDQSTGTTLLIPGTHLVFDDQALAMESEQPSLAKGDCLLMDYRLLHQGTANHSDQVRPLLFLGYTRPWFRDYENFKKQTRLVLDPRERERISPDLRHLFL